MAAVDLYDNFLQRLTEIEQQYLVDLIASSRADLQGARSEEARLRVADEFVRNARDFLRAEKA
jgi:hypothetical protein